MLKLIVFDCDGVMFDSRNANREYYNHLLVHFGKPLMNKEELEYVHMHNVTLSVKHIFRHYPQQDVGEVEAFRRQLDYTPFLRFMRMEDDLIQFLDWAKKRFDLAISTNRTTTMTPLLKKFKLEDYFGKVMTADTAKLPKPAPDALIEILEHYNYRPDQAIYIGDSVIDRQHSKAACMRLIAFKNPELPAEFHVSSFMEICALPPLA
jgi:phosphoglycolate phosphatase-like HAD superfamily hydrolase